MPFPPSSDLHTCCECYCHIRDHVRVSTRCADSELALVRQRSAGGRDRRDDAGSAAGLAVRFSSSNISPGSLLTMGLVYSKEMLHK